MKKKILSFLLALCMIVGMFPTVAAESKKADAPNSSEIKSISENSSSTSSAEFSIGEASFSMDNSGTKITADLSRMKGVSKVLVTYILNGKETNYTTKAIPATTKSTSLSVYVIKAITEIRVYYYDMKGVKYKTPKSYSITAAATEMSIGEASFSMNSKGTAVTAKLSGIKGVSKVLVTYILNGKEKNYTSQIIPSSTKTKSINVPVKTGITEIKVYYYDMKGVKSTTSKSYSVKPVVSPTPKPKPTPTVSTDMDIGEVAFAMNKSNTLVIVTLMKLKNVSKVTGYYVTNGKQVLDTYQTFKKSTVDTATIFINAKAGATEVRIYYYDKNGVLNTTPKTYQIGADATGKHYTYGYEVLNDTYRNNVNGALGEVVITENVKEIQGYAFYGSKSLNTFSLQNNTNFTVVDGVLFNKDKTKLIAYPQSKRGTTYTVPDSVVEIENGAFGYNKYLTKINFGANLKTIGIDAFRSCNFTELVLPEGVTTIMGCAFIDNKALKKVTIPVSVTSLSNDFIKNSDSGIVIYGKAGSEAERFALRYGYKFNNTQAPTDTQKEAPNFTLGDTADKITDKCFNIISTSEGMWKLFGSYEKFLAVYFVNDKATFIYTNDLSGYKYVNENIYTDKNNNNKKYAASMGKLPTDDKYIAEQLVFEFTNAFRGLHGLSALKWNDNLRDAARVHSEDMNARNFISHVNPDGKGACDRIAAAGYDGKNCAENIAKIGSGFNVIDGVDGWINSSGHRANILTSVCNEIGVGVSGDYATQNFGKQ